MIDISKGNNFHEYFKQFGELWLGSSSFSMKQPAPVTQPIMSRFQCSIFFFFFFFFFFLKFEGGTIKNCKCPLLNMAGSSYIVTWIKS